MSDNKFEGKVVIVTGAASGIGRSIITEFVRSGAKGVIVDLDKEWAESTYRKSTNKNDRHFSY